MQKYPSGTMDRRPFTNAPKKCTSLPWNTKGKNHINAWNQNWLKELAKGFSEAKWEINCILTLNRNLRSRWRTYTFISRRNYPPMYRIQCSTQETPSTWQHIPHWASPNTTLPHHNSGRASTFTTNGTPALTTLLTKGIQPNKKEPRLYKHIANTTATNYSYYLPLWPCTH